MLLKGGHFPVHSKCRPTHKKIHAWQLCCHCLRVSVRSLHCCVCLCVYLSMMAVHVSVQRSGAGSVGLAVTLVLSWPWTHKTKNTLHCKRMRERVLSHTDAHLSLRTQAETNKCQKKSKEFPTMSNLSFSLCEKYLSADVIMLWFGQKVLTSLHRTVFLLPELCM